MGYAFISYSTQNQTYADAMRELFHRHNIDTWMAPYDIPGGSKYAAVITKAIRNCSCFVLLLSNDSQASEAVDSEVELAALTFKKTIITVELEKVVLNDAFTFYIHNKQIIALHKIGENSPEAKQILTAVKAYTGESEIHRKPEASDAENVSQKAWIETYSGRMILDNRYELRSIIGEGGFGVTYKAIDLKEQRTVAVKVGSFAKARESVNLHRFLIGKTNENLCSVYDATVTANEEVYIAMEWFKDARSLDRAKDHYDFYHDLDDNHFVDSHVRVLCDVLHGLKCLHSCGIIHNDINPSNIMSNGFVTKVIDYSSSYFLHKPETAPEHEHTYIIGKYGCPECKKDYRSDIYSVGMVAYKWLTGSEPQINSNGTLSFDSVRIDREAMLILQKATANNPDDRYQTCDAFIDDLEHYRRLLWNPTFALESYVLGKR